MRYAIIIEGEPGSYSAYVPDLPGCIVAGESLDEIMREMSAAIRFHLDGLREDGLNVPAPSAAVAYIEVEV